MEWAIVASTLIASVAYTVPKVMIIRAQAKMIERQIEALVAQPRVSGVPEWGTGDFPGQGVTVSDADDTFSGSYR